MIVSTFLSNETYWRTLVDLVKTAKRVDAAIAYFGQGGAKRLPLRRGDRLVVDMSAPTVRAGGTDPHEVEKLIRRGVHAFTRRNLHAKIVVADESVIAGSANVSKHSQEVLDEAAVLTNDQSAVRRAREFIDGLCTEPIRPEYLEQCKRLYNPPRLPGERDKGSDRQQRAKHAKLWIVNLTDRAVPDPEIERYEKGEAEAKKRVKDIALSETDSFHWSHKPKMADKADVGDWFIQVVTSKDKTTTVYPPGQLLYIDSYVRDAVSGRERFVFHLEIPKRGEPLTWKEFSQAAKSLVKTTKLDSPRTKAITDVLEADGFLGLWTPSGRVSRRRSIGDD